MMKEKKIPRMSHVVLLNLKRVPNANGKLMPECVLYLSMSVHVPGSQGPRAWRFLLSSAAGACTRVRSVIARACIQVGRHGCGGMRRAEHAADGHVAGSSMCAHYHALSLSPVMSMTRSKRSMCAARALKFPT
jgi:hypothetical protein